MQKKYSILILLFSSIGMLSCSKLRESKELPCNVNETKSVIEDVEEIYPKEISEGSLENIEDFLPNGWTQVAIAYGDLDGVDGDEAVVIYNTATLGEDELGYIRHLAIYKKNEMYWELWHQNGTVLLDSQVGGVLGDPFNGINISDKTLNINHFGGSAEKWGYHHSYQFQDGDWYLIKIGYSFGSGSAGYNLELNLIDGSYNLSDYETQYNEDGSEGDFEENNEEGVLEISPIRMDDIKIGKNNLFLGNHTIYY